MTQTVFQLPAEVQALVDQGYHFSKWWDLENGLCPKRHLIAIENIKPRHDTMQIICLPCRRDNERKRRGTVNPYKLDVPPDPPEASSPAAPGILKRMGALRPTGASVVLVCQHRVTYGTPVGVLEPLWCTRCGEWREQQDALRFRR